MLFKVQAVTSDSEFAELALVERLSFESPPCQLMNLYFPLLDPNAPGAREAAIAEAAERQALWHSSDPTSMWIKVVDEESGALAGAALWHIYDSNPYAKHSEDECTWFAEGEDRVAANELMGQFFTPRTKNMQKPHVFLDIAFTHPDYRRKGVGKLFMEWGIKEADKRDLDMYIDATAEGLLLYQTFGFVADKPRDFNLGGIPESERKKELENLLLPFKWWPMFRFAHGNPRPANLLPWAKLK